MEIIGLIIGLALALMAYLIVNRNSSVIRFPELSLMDGDKPNRLILCLRRIILSRKKKLSLDIGYVKEFNFGTYLVMLAQTEKAIDKGKSISLFSKRPLSSSVRRTLMITRENSQTYHQHLTGLDSRFIKKSDISLQVLENITKDLRKIGVKDYFELNTMITEILGNAIEHGLRGLNINWWMYHNIEKNSMRLIFVDMGMGIISSYRSAGIGLFDSDQTLILKAFNGKAGSSTKEHNRGRGLPQIGYMVKNNLISDFVLITNRVSLRFSNRGYELKSHPDFVGTYYSWTVNKDNFERWKSYIM
ncbi:MAG: hypothetical protein K2N34_04995 [Lachnospiraceae bacterium]|nr:hypothetical protein [Lachnospiraceae bacterium]